MKLVWNAILKNEAAIIDRCVNSLLPHIDGAIIVDTGSTDNTVERLMELFTAAGKSLEIHKAPFVDFSQARNAALKAARDSSLPWQYALLADADMELVVEDPEWAEKLNGGPAYDVKQTAGSVAYWNRRLLSRSVSGWYQCPTHEYLDVPGAGSIEGIWFKDHADGANRPDKFQRDIKLLEDALRTETREGLLQRYHFYLGQSYFDLGNWRKAAFHYHNRTAMGGFDEEIWNSQLHYAHCLDNMHDKPGFLWEALHAYQLRPHRPESLYDLAKFFRERGENHISLLFSEAGMRLPYPDKDLLFVNKHACTAGLKEEFAICAYYDESKRDRGAKVCDELALDKELNWHSREQARNNQFWYLKPLVQHVPSFRPTRIPLAVPDGYVAANPSVINHQGEPTVLVRTVNYVISPEGSYLVRGDDGSCSRDYPIRTVNYMVDLSSELELLDQREILLPNNWPESKFPLVQGFEDSRLFELNDGLWTTSTVREITPEGWCETVLAPIEFYGPHNDRDRPDGTVEQFGKPVACYGGDWVQILPAKRQHEKNWMPFVLDGELRFVYRLGTLIDSKGETIHCSEPRFAASHISGGSQVIDVEGRYFALVHEARTIPGRSTRYYQHRFVQFDKAGQLIAISMPFVFHERVIEFAAGLAYFPEKKQLMVSYGREDKEAWLAMMDVDDVLSFLWGRT